MINHCLNNVLYADEMYSFTLHEEFIQFSQANFDSRSALKTISGFVFLMTGKANQLIKRAELFQVLTYRSFEKSYLTLDACTSENSVTGEERMQDDN